MEMGYEDEAFLLRETPSISYEMSIFFFFRHKLMELEDVAMQIALDTNRYMLVIDE